MKYALLPLVGVCTLLNKTIETITEIRTVLMGIMGVILVFMETRMDLVGLYW